MQARPRRSPARQTPDELEEPTPPTALPPLAPDPNDPTTYRRTAYTVNTDVEDIYKRWDEAVPQEGREVLEQFATELMDLDPTSQRELATSMITLRRRCEQGRKHPIPSPPAPPQPTLHHPNPIQPNPTQSNPFQPNPTQPNPTQSNPTQPNPT